MKGPEGELVVHGTQDFDYDKARKVLGVPDNFEVCAMVAIEGVFRGR